MFLLTRSRTLQPRSLLCAIHNPIFAGARRRTPWTSRGAVQIADLRPRGGVTAGAALSAYPARAHAAGADLRTAQAGQAAVDAAGGSE